MSKVRADVGLVHRGLAASREKAQALIMAGLVFQREVRINKPSETVNDINLLRVKECTQPYVSRGALKLEKALQVFGADVSGKVAMDIGSAAGGFTDVLLRNGAAHIYSIDVGYGQLDWTIRNDRRVTVMERTNARYLTSESFPITPTLTVMDVSFISLKLILPVAGRLMKENGVFYVLIKPQFEAGRGKVGKKGVVRDPLVHVSVIEGILKFSIEIGYAMTQLDFSPIKGPEGNIEYLAELVPISKEMQPINARQITCVVASAHHHLIKTRIE